jgi:invasion protein IalB
VETGSGHRHRDLVPICAAAVVAQAFEGYARALLPASSLPMTSPRIRLSPLLFALLAFAALAEDATDASVSFSHGDWELVCDNTGTCRAGGYQSESEGLPVSVLLTRAANSRWARIG